MANFFDLLYTINAKKFLVHVDNFFISAVAQQKYLIFGDLTLPTYAQSNGIICMNFPTMSFQQIKSATELSIADVWETFSCQFKF